MIERSLILCLPLCSGEPKILQHRTGTSSEDSVMKSRAYRIPLVQIHYTMNPVFKSREVMHPKNAIQGSEGGDDRGEEYVDVIPDGRCTFSVRVA